MIPATLVHLTRGDHEELSSGTAAVRSLADDHLRRESVYRQQGLNAKYNLQHKEICFNTNCLTIITLRNQFKLADS